jgi:mycothiol synthase
VGLGVKALLKIRSFRKGFDEPVFVDIFNVAFGDYDDIRMVTLEDFGKMMDAPRYNTDGLFIAEWDGEPAGMVDAYADKLSSERKGIIQYFGVLPEFRRRGVGGRLLERALESHDSRGTRVVDAWAQSDRRACVYLFESFGFKSVRVTSMMKKSLVDLGSSFEEADGVCVREMRVGDDSEVSLLNRLDNEAFSEHFNYRPKSVEETRYGLFEMPWFKVQKVFFACARDEPVGYAIAGVDVRLNEEKKVEYGWVLDVGVLKPHRRMGVGANLMLQSMRWLGAQGMRDVLLYVDDLNPTGAMKLYERLGFRVTRKNLIYRLNLA